MPHVVASALKRAVFVRFVFWRCLREVEDHHLWTILADDIKAVFVGSLCQHVVAIHKLQVFACRHLDACVTGTTQPLVLLTDIDDVVSVFHQVVHRTGFRAVVNHDDLPFVWLQCEGEDAVDTFAEHLHREVIVGQDETD